MRSAVYVPEIWPTEAKLRGSAWRTPWVAFSGIAAPYAVAVLLSNYGVTGVFILLSVVAIIVAAAIATIGIETKGASVESIGMDAVTTK
jgi:putative MFS transporter